MEGSVNVKPLDASTMELELMVEDELARLQRQYRIMESDRMAYLDHVQGNMGKQNSIITNLRQEHESLIINLKVANSKHNRRKDNNIMQEIKRLLETHATLVECIKRRKNYIKEIDYQIRKVEKQMIEVHIEMRTIETSHQDRIGLVQKNIYTLENKLETSKNRYGLILSNNKRLRLEIDHLLNERQLFNKNWEQLFCSLESSKKFMMDLIEQATLAYDQREEWCQKLEALRYRAYNDLQYHSEEMRELRRTLDRDIALQQFLNVKGQRRIAGDLLKKELMKREASELRVKDQREKYSKILRDIQECAGIEDVDCLASQFVKQEEENFALFNYIHELNSELESLADSVGATQIKIGEQQQIQRQRTVKQTENIDYIKKFLLDLTDSATAAHDKCLSLNRTLRIIFREIERLFQKLKCDKAPILDLLGQVVARQQQPATSIARTFSTWYTSLDLYDDTGNNEGGDHIFLTVYNVELYLGILESTINEIMKRILYRQGRKSRKLMMTAAAEKQEKPQVDSIVTPCPLCYATLLKSRTDVVTYVMNPKQIRRTIKNYTNEISWTKMCHTVSNCDLPQSMNIMRKRFDNSHV